MTAHGGEDIGQVFATGHKPTHELDIVGSLSAL